VISSVVTARVWDSYFCVVLRAQFHRLSVSSVIVPIPDVLKRELRARAIAQTNFACRRSSVTFASAASSLALLALSAPAPPTPA